MNIVISKPTATRDISELKTLFINTMQEQSTGAERLRPTVDTSTTERQRPLGRLHSPYIIFQVACSKLKNFRSAFSSVPLTAVNSNSGMPHFLEICLFASAADLAIATCLTSWGPPHPASNTVNSILSPFCCWRLESKYLAAACLRLVLES